jgi:molybdate transport system ATP-binding protein
MVFQDYLLFPHLSVLDNVAFGLTTRGVRTTDARRRALGWLERVGLVELARARTREISGGQAQRVALARALASEPDLLLLDEPLAALDASTRMLVRADLRHQLAELEQAVIMVTHDPVDAAVRGSRMVVIEAGREVQQGTPAEIARRPRSEYVARLVGLNLVEAADVGTLEALAMPLLATSSHAERTLAQAELPWPCAWVMGHEGQGVSAELEARAAHRIRIAQPGGEESLNVAAAAAICLHASAAQAGI